MEKEEELELVAAAKVVAFLLLLHSI